MSIRKDDSDTYRYTHFRPVRITRHWSLEDAICDVCELRIEVDTRGYVTSRDELTVVLCQTCGQQAGAAPFLPL